MTEQQDKQHPPTSKQVPAPEQASPETGHQQPTPQRDSQPRPAPPIPTPAQIPSPSQLGRKAPVATPVRPKPVPVDTADEAQAIADAQKYGKVDAEGNVFVVEQAGERLVGQYPGVSNDEALSLYVRRYLDIKAQVLLFETRLPTLSAKDLDQGLAAVKEAVKEPAAVGDLDELRTQVHGLEERVSQRKEEIAQEREDAKARSLEARTDIVERAEAIAALDPQKIQWRQQGEQLRSLLEEWKQAQRSGARIDKATEDALWKRFSTARSTFDRARRQFFAELDRKHAAAKEVKEKLIERAEALQDSTDWGPTTQAYRELMEEWKAAGRASRKDDDALWARFRAAQDVFFQARQKQNAERDAEYEKNLEVKLQLLEEAEKLLPVTDLERAKTALRDIQDRWEEAGRVPRSQVRNVEGRLRAVERAVRDADDAEWQRTNPQLQERVEGAAAQLHAAIDSLERKLQKAQETGDESKIKAAQEALDARKLWLERVLKAAEEVN